MTFGRNVQNTLAIEFACFSFRKLKHTNSILEYFKYFCQMSSKIDFYNWAIPFQSWCIFFWDTCRSWGCFVGFNR